MVHIPNNHVGSKVTKTADGESTCTCTLKTLLKNTVRDDERDLVLKLDCEGAEFEILLSTDAETMSRFNVVYIEVHGNCNENPAYQDVQLVRDKLASFGFKQVSTMPVYGYPNGEPVEMGIDVDKWVRA